jgi:hypothetical protein
MIRAQRKSLVKGSLADLLKPCVSSLCRYVDLSGVNCHFSQNKCIQRYHFFELFMRVIVCLADLTL